MSMRSVAAQSWSAGLAGALSVCVATLTGARASWRRPCQWVRSKTRSRTREIGSSGSSRDWSMRRNWAHWILPRFTGFCSPNILGLLGLLGFVWLLMGSDTDSIEFTGFTGLCRFFLMFDERLYWASWQGQNHAPGCDNSVREAAHSIMRTAIKFYKRGA